MQADLIFLRTLPADPNRPRAIATKLVRRAAQHFAIAHDKHCESAFPVLHQQKLSLSCNTSVTNPCSTVQVVLSPLS